MRSRADARRESIDRQDEILRDYANIPDEEADPENEFKDDC